ncbi:hypothetical protein OS493_039801 [Desmophyllum pertusum]|uniref:Uncharacterized protein n=1 Tax=Desmophyllum pertusum TaxID=174260 RepID=A0A9X0CCD3_9CNID|nr:hypothetical protein OS493_039801 [Desmophyllum pertusum]
MEDDEATPRGIIRGVLTCRRSISRECPTLRTRGKHQSSKYCEENSDQSSVPLRSSNSFVLNRSDLPTRERFSSSSISYTFRLNQHLELWDFYKQLQLPRVFVKRKRQKTVEPDTTLAETPEEPLLSASSDVEDIPQQSDEEGNRSSLVTSVAPVDTGTETDEQSVAMTTSHQTDHVTLMEAATPMLLDSYEDDEAAAQKYEFDVKFEFMCVKLNVFPCSLYLWGTLPNLRRTWYLFTAGIKQKL